MAIKYTATQIDENPVGPDGIGKSGSPYKAYVALLTVDFGLSKRLHSGSLVIGKTYLIAFTNTTGDFTNVGSENNNVGTFFVATDTIPTAWGDATLIFDPQPASTIMNGNDNNYLGDVVWEYMGAGRYKGSSNEIHAGKTIVTITNSAFLDSTIAVGVNEGFISIQTGTGTTPDDSILFDTPIKIEVYQN